MPQKLPEKAKVQVWIYLHEAGALRVLLLKLVDERGGFWQPVTGHVEDGEAPGPAALREATEESGLSFGGALVDLEFQFSFEARGARFTEHVFGLRAGLHAGVRAPDVASVLPLVRLDPREHVAYRWVDARDAFALLHFPTNAQGLSALLRKIAPVA